MNDLARRILDGNEALMLPEDVCALLRRTGAQVALGAQEVEQALSDVSRATGLLREIDRRITEGTHRLPPALLRMYRFRDAGDIEGACRQMEESIGGMEALLLGGGLVQAGGGADGWGPRGRARRRWREPSTSRGHTAALTALA